MALLDLNPVLKTDEERLRFIDEVTKDVGRLQDRVLAEILSKNADTEYLQRHGLGGATDGATFKAKIPVVTYDDLRPDIERIANALRHQVER
ncbi:probable indole-3-acetic acid-amido synthetase GH3.8 [Asparagus officinalis]|uniref:probable indole-3-acetic acid-amido synthetase GH3.8 n=1 Tax=Asparagus officinalis TaxID=4686 RepID=UPI00098E7C9F|nr:probable indole-3-acetic acid-amido synthetase GH3.8 [Asparagus officinalis]